MTLINVYCDEVILHASKNYMVLGALFVKDTDVNKVLELLENCRCLNTSNNKWNYNFIECCNKENCKEHWHNKNNTNIHFTEIDRSRDRKNIAKKWLTLLRSSLKKYIKFSLLVIDLKKLNCEYFGKNKTDLNIYNRFFRTLLNGGSKYLYNKQHVKINTVYHDEGSQEKHSYFPELNLEKLELETSNALIILNKKIKFINDDHRRYLKKHDMDLVKCSQFIQLIDIILGSFTQLYLNNSENDDKKEVAEIVRGLFDDVFKRKGGCPYSVSFFPKYSLDELSHINQQSLLDFNEKDIEFKIDTAIKYSGNFYNKACFSMPKFDKSQLDLTAWI
ncbi:MAG: hypothetical protein SCH70_11555 [Candidatus Methanoperedens sp.]|nr:hypothetical protein [Candidatus Methanoperedens sp.]